MAAPNPNKTFINESIGKFRKLEKKFLLYFNKNLKTVLYVNYYFLLLLRKLFLPSCSCLVFNLKQFDT